MQLKSYIELLLDPIFIYSKYLNLDTHTIENCLTTGATIKNPLRLDKNPSAGFKFRKNKIVFTDYAKPEYGGDIYHVVGIVLNRNCNNSTDFIFICEHIIANLIYNTKVFSTFTPTNITLKDVAVSAQLDIIEFTEITIEYKKWDNNTFKYWYNYVKPNKEIAKLLIVLLQKWDIYPIEKYWLNNNIRASRLYKDDNPMYAYLLKTNAQGRHYKLYFPNAINKFVTNSSDTFNYTDRIPFCRFAVLVKSVKDGIFLNVIAEYLNIQDVVFIPTSSESVTFQTADLEYLKNYDKTFSFYDFDETGVINSYKNALLYNIEPIFITNKLFNPLDIKVKTIEMVNALIEKNIKYKHTITNFIDFVNIYSIKSYIKTKDFSDYILEYGIDKGISLFKLYYEAIKQREDEAAYNHEVTHFPTAFGRRHGVPTLRQI